MRAIALGLSVLVTLAAAAATAVVLVKAPIQPIAFAAIAVDEKAWILVAIALFATALARAADSTRWWALAFLVTCGIAGVGAVISGRAIQVARARHVSLDYARWLLSPVDLAPAAPNQTLTYATVDGRALKVDVYKPRPPHRSGPRVPAVIVVHGGGWSAGDKGEASLTSVWLATRGYAVFDIQYRLAPPPTWQAAVGDVKCAVAWVKHNGHLAGVDVDPARVTLLGRSAGGHLALLAAYAPDDSTLMPSCPLAEPTDAHVASVISLYGFTDLPWAWDHPVNPRVFDTRDRVSKYAGATLDADPWRYKLLSPVERVTAHAPRTLLIHGDADQIVPVDQVDRLATKLDALGVPHDVLVIPYAQHAFDFVAGGLSGQLAEHAIVATLGEP
jgi:acetyl esterase/lipase